MLRILDKRDTPSKPVSGIKISVEKEFGFRRFYIRRIEDLKPGVLNGSLIDLICEIEERLWPAKGSIAELCGTHAYYGGQYLRLNFQPRIDSEFLRVWAERHRAQVPRGRMTYEDAIAVTADSQQGWWIIRLTKKEKET